MAEERAGKGAEELASLRILRRRQRPSAVERTQAFAILIEFYQNALEVFVPHADTKVTNPVSISRQFIADLKSLDDTGLININMTRKPAAG